MLPLLITPPQLEPLGLAEAKAWLRIDGDDENDTVAALIAAARALVEQAAGRRLLHQTWRIVLDAWPPERRLVVPLSPVASVVEARVLAADGTPTVVAAEALRLDQRRDPVDLILMGPLPQPGRPAAGIEIDVLCGFSADPAGVPEPLRHAVRLLVARWFEHRGDAARDAIALPPDVALMIAPYRRARL